MKETTAEIRQKIYDGIPVYTKCTIMVNHKETGTVKTFKLEPTDFTVQDNSYTVNGGYDIPIGKVVSKSIKLSIDNTGDRFYGYDLNTGIIGLQSVVYPNGIGQTARAFNEGVFYVDNVDIVNYTIKLTAYDRISVLDTPFIIRTATSTHTALYPTIWDYFVHLCDDVYRELIGEPETAGVHWYSSELSSNHFLNSDMPLAAIEGASKATMTLREVFGYIAQIAGGVVVLDSMEKINIKSLQLSSVIYINGLTFSDTVTETYDGGILGEVHSWTSYSALAFTSTPNTALLDRYVTPPVVEYTDVEYTKVTISYPIPNNEKGGSASVGSSDYNVLKLNNPLCQRSNDNNADIVVVANKIRNRIGNTRTIKPFSGTFTNNPLIELLDNVIIVDSNGIAHNSFVGEHTMNYLGSSEISNRTPTVGQNKRTYAEAP